MGYELNVSIGTIGLEYAIGKDFHNIDRLAFSDDNVGRPTTNLYGYLNDPEETKVPLQDGVVTTRHVTDVMNFDIGSYGEHTLLDKANTEDGLCGLVFLFDGPRVVLIDDYGKYLRVHRPEALLPAIEEANRMNPHIVYQSLIVALQLYIPTQCVAVLWGR